MVHSTFYLDHIPVRFDQGCNQDNQHCVLLIHGLFNDLNENNRFSRLTALLNSHGFDVYRFDYRCHGENHCPPYGFRLSDAISDFDTVFQFINAKNYISLNIIAMSFGCTLPLLSDSHQANEKLTTITLMSSLLNFDVFLPDYKGVKSDFILFDEFKQDLRSRDCIQLANGFLISNEFLQEINQHKPYLGFSSNIQYLICHGGKDKRIPIDSVKEKLPAGNNTETYFVNDADHTFSREEDETRMFNKIVSFLSDNCC